MLCAGLFIVLLLAWVTPALSEPAETPTRLAAPPSDQTVNQPIDLTMGFHSPLIPPSGDDARLPVFEQPESSPEPVSRSLGLPRSGPVGMMSKREHVAWLRLHGVTLFGGSIAGSVDGRSAHIELSWPTNP